MKCPICSSDSRLWGIRDGYEVYGCPHCGHGNVNLATRDVNKITAAYAGESDPDQMLHGSAEQYYRSLCNGEEPGGQTYTTTRLAIDALKHESPAKTPSLLEIGPGSGFLLQEIKRAGWTGIGVEPGPWGQIAAERKGVKVISGYLDFNTLTERFDAVAAMDVIEHTPDPRAFLRLLRSYLKPGGLVLLSFPNKNSLHARLFGTGWTMVMPPAHLQFFTLESIRLALAQCDLELRSTVCFENTGIQYHLLGRYIRKIPGAVALAKAILNWANYGDQRFVCARAAAN